MYNSLLSAWGRMPKMKGMRALRLYRSINLGSRIASPMKDWLLGTAQKIYKYWDGSEWLTITNYVKVRLIGSNYTLTKDDHTVVCEQTLTVTLPQATGSGQTYRIICRSGTTTIDGNSTDTIKGELTQTLMASEDLIITDTSPKYWE